MGSCYLLVVGKFESKLKRFYMETSKLGFSCKTILLQDPETTISSYVGKEQAAHFQQNIRYKSVGLLLCPCETW